MEFGAFLAPWHKVGTDANTAIHQDLQLVEHMDRLGFAEFWIGEHHSGGVEIVAAPEMFLAAAAQRTARIKLGLGVVSLPYHNPFMVADRVVLLDHLSRGRVIFGAGLGGPIDDEFGSFGETTDPVELAELLDEGLELLAVRVVKLKPATLLRIAKRAMNSVSSPVSARDAGEPGAASD